MGWDSSDDENDCPLCMEPMDFTDRAFKPCPCDYRLCSFCFNRLMSEGGARCPACRSEYTGENYAEAVDFNALKKADRERAKQVAKEERQRAREQQARALSRSTVIPRVAPTSTSSGSVSGSSSTSHHGDPTKASTSSPTVGGLAYVMFRDAVFVENLSRGMMAFGESHLAAESAFGKYGVVRCVRLYKSRKAAHVVYERPVDALIAVRAMDGSTVDGRAVRATFASARLCSAPSCVTLQQRPLARGGSDAARIYGARPSDGLVGLGPGASFCIGAHCTQAELQDVVLALVFFGDQPPPATGAEKSRIATMLTEDALSKSGGINRAAAAANRGGKANEFPPRGTVTRPANATSAVAGRGSPDSHYTQRMVELAQYSMASAMPAALAAPVARGLSASTGAMAPSKAPPSPARQSATAAVPPSPTPAARTATPPSSPAPSPAPSPASSAKDKKARKKEAAAAKAAAAAAARAAARQAAAREEAEAAAAAAAAQEEAVAAAAAAQAAANARAKADAQAAADAKAAARADAMFPAHLKDAFSSVFSDGPPPSSLPVPDFFRPHDGGSGGDPFSSSSFGAFGGPPPGVPPPGFGSFAFPPPPQTPSYPQAPGGTTSSNQGPLPPFGQPVPSYFGQQSNPSADAAVAALKALLPGVPVAFDEQNPQSQRQSNNLFAAFDY